MCVLNAGNYVVFKFCSGKKANNTNGHFNSLNVYSVSKFSSLHKPIGTVYHELVSADFIFCQNVKQGTINDCRHLSYKLPIIMNTKYEIHHNSGNICLVTGILTTIT